MPPVGAAIGAIAGGIGAGAAAVGAGAAAVGAGAVSAGGALLTGIGSTASGALTLGGTVVGMAGKAAGAIVNNAEPISKLVGSGLQVYSTVQQLTGKTKSNTVAAVSGQAQPQPAYYLTNTTSGGSGSKGSDESQPRQLDTTQILLFVAAGLFAYLLIKK